MLCTVALLSEAETWAMLELFCDKVTYLSIQLKMKNAKRIVERAGYIF